MSGDEGEEVTPVPIPNTEVKLFSADGSWGLPPVRVGRCQALDNFIKIVAGWSSLVARRAHNPKVVGSNPAPAIEVSYFQEKHLKKPRSGSSVG